jgi:hypothetical protein
MKRTLTLIAAATIAASALAVPARYSKLGIVTAARKMGRLEAMNAWIQAAGYWDEWLACQVFQDDYDGFSAITNAVVVSGLATSAEIASILEFSRVENETARLLAVIESDKNLREKYHGGRIGTYILTNETGRLISVDLYGDATAYTNGTTQAMRPPVDPEALAKEMARRAAEHERIVAAWEAANLPPDLAALRAAQREAARQAKEAEAE